MDPIGTILNLFFGRLRLTTISGRDISLVKGWISKSGATSVQIPDEVIVQLIEEARRRAAAHERDGVARVGRTASELQVVVEAAIKAFSKDLNGDLRVRQILEFAGLI